MYYCGKDGTRRYFDCVIAVLDADGRHEVADPILLTQAGDGRDARTCAVRGARRYMVEQTLRLGLCFELVCVVDSGSSVEANDAYHNWQAARLWLTQACLD